MKDKRWNIEVFIDEHDGFTRAEVRLINTDQTGLRGVGTARRHPRDVEIPEIGDELAVSRALSDLAHRLLDATIDDIEAVTGRPAHVTS